MITEGTPSMAELVALYLSVGWTSYIDDPERLVASVHGSSLVLVARGAGGEVQGLARCLSDGHTICYVQDLLVDPAHHRKGIGRALLQRCLDLHAGCRQIVLMTDARPEQKAFYEALGLRDLTELGLRGFVRLQ